MYHSLHRADPETHVRIVVLALVAGIAVVIGALNMKTDRGAGPGAWARAGVTKALRQPIFSLSESRFVR